MIWKYFIKNPLKELYWIGGTWSTDDEAKHLFTMYPHKAKRFNTVEEAEKEITLGGLPKGIYEIVKYYKI